MGKEATRGAFWADLNEDLKDPELRRHYLLESERIAAIDSMINQLDDIRVDLGLSKAALARAIERTPETVRRLFTSQSVNPQLSIVIELATALGYRLTLTPMNSADERHVARPLRERATA